MSIRAIIGGQWGDEGKGKVVDFLCEDADIVIRYQGGGNAGHTVVVSDRIAGDKKYKLHQVPSGIVRGKTSILGNGMVIDLQSLKTEIETLRAQGVNITSENLIISDRAHITRPVHQQLDGISESHENKIGTTKKGIGPTYADKMRRTGLRVVDALNQKKLEASINSDLESIVKNNPCSQCENMRLQEETKRLLELVEFFKPFVKNVVEYLHFDDIDVSKKNILLEGAQGSLLDIDFGTYPFVTSSNTVGFQQGCGIDSRKIQEVIGVFKAYLTRVGEGPFPTEQNNDIGERLREIGGEYGTTTGRPRRCGWFDAFAAKYSATVFGIDSIALTKLDVLSTFDVISVCVGYEYGGKMLKTLPSDADVLSKVVPQFIQLPGWKCDISKIACYNDLPENAKRYLDRLTKLVGIPITMLSYGCEREKTLLLNKNNGRYREIEPIMTC